MHIYVKRTLLTLLLLGLTAWGLLFGFVATLYAVMTRNA